MDKKNLFYIVRTGTNRRMQTKGIPLIVTAKGAIRELNTALPVWVKISIEEFEETYEFKTSKPEVKEE